MPDASARSSPKRIHLIDLMKGIGILLVILQHCISVSGVVSSVWGRISLVILPFHMPLFFFASGFLYRKNESSVYLAGKVRGLLIPALLFQMLNVIIILVLNALELRNPMGILFAGFWFVYSALYVSCIYHLIETFLEKKVDLSICRVRYHCFFAGCMLAAGILYSKMIQGREDTVAIAMVAYFFYAAGSVCRNCMGDKKLAYDPSPKARCIYAIIGLGLLGILFFTAKWNLPVYMYISSYGNWMLFLLNALLGIAAVFCISVAIYQCMALEYYGKNSLSIVITHFPVYTFALLKLKEISFDGTALILGALVDTVVLEAPIAYAIGKCFPCLAGRSAKANY